MAVALAVCSCWTAPPTNLGGDRVLGSNGLAYHATQVGTRLLVSVELTVRFELVIRRLDSATDGFGISAVELKRVDLGPPDWDITGVASAARGPLVWVSSRDGTVRGIDVELARIVSTWKVGSAVSAIATDSEGRYLSYATDDGILCLRRLPDGALLQCLQTGTGAITALSIGGARLVAADAGGKISFYQRRTLRKLNESSIDGRVSALREDDSGHLAVVVGDRPGAGDPRSGKLVLIDRAGSRIECPPTKSGLTSVAWGEKQGLISGSLDGSLTAWRLDRGMCRAIRERSFGGPIAYVASFSSFNSVGEQKAVAVGLWSKGGEPTTLLLRYTNDPR